MTKLLMIAAITCLHLACSQSKNTTMPDTHNSKNSVDWDGIYRGVLPCADCEGIQTTIYLQRDLTFTSKSKYLGKEGDEVVVKGSFTWNAAGSQVSLKAAAGGEAIIYQVGENILTQLDGNGNKITGGLASHYILSKQAFALYERYWNLVELNGQPIQLDSSFKKEPHIIFKEGNKVMGNGGCNSFSGSFHLDGLGRISVSKLANTLMACPNMPVEDQFLKALQQADSYTVSGDVLTLNKAKMAPLARFKSRVMQ